MSLDQTNDEPITIFLGAGFSASAGLPIASQLLDHRPDVDRVTRSKLVDRVVSRWELWRSHNGGTTEEYLAQLTSRDPNAFRDAVWFVGLAITLRMAQLQTVGANLTITKHNLDRTSTPELEQFWSTIFTARTNVSVITTNFDILAERGLRHTPRPKAKRPGFHYGFGNEQLAGGGYPAYAHIQKISVQGNIPLFKLHGSVSWSLRNGKLVKYHDCRPAIRGDAAIVAPLIEKTIPKYLRSTWTRAKLHLQRSKRWIVVGYSLPLYDEAVLSLLRQAILPNTTIHVFDPDASVAKRFRQISRNIYSHPGLPNGLDQLATILS